jgi:exopolysaccharide production protein ExoY
MTPGDTNASPPDARIPGSGTFIPVWKRAVDVAFCLVALPAFGVATLCIAALTGITSRGPIFFRQERVGFRGRRFKLYKFRTMHVSAEVATHEAHFAELVRSNTPMQKMDARGDSRLIAGGRWLRAAGLDELPQLINVLRGDMSLVGPRPCIPYEYDQYSVEQKERFACVPGLTGLWQVSGKNRTTFEEMVQLDVTYSRNQSPMLDLGIIIMTIPAVCGQIVAVRKVHTVRQGSASAHLESASSTSQGPDLSVPPKPTRTGVGDND